MYTIHLLLDTDVAYSANEARTEFTWLVNDGNPTTLPGYLNVNAPLRNITSMRISRTAFSNLHAVEADAINANTPLAVSIKELQTQAIISPTGLKFHFIQSRANDEALFGTNVVCTSFYQNKGIFNFHTCVTHLTSITLSYTDIYNTFNVSLPDSYFTINAIQHVGTYLGQNNPLEIPDYKYLPVVFNDVVSGTYLSNTVEPVVVEQFTTADVTGDAPLIANYNAMHTLYQIDGALWASPIDISAGTYVATSIPVTIRLRFKPRYITSLVLEVDT